MPHRGKVRRPAQRYTIKKQNRKPRIQHGPDPVEIYTNVNAPHRPHFVNYIHLTKIEDDDTGAFIQKLKDAFNFGSSTFNILPLRQTTYQSTYETRFYADMQILLGVYEICQDLRIDASFDGNMRLQRMYEALMNGEQQEVEENLETTDEEHREDKANMTDNSQELTSGEHCLENSTQISQTSETDDGETEESIETAPCLREFEFAMESTRGRLVAMNAASNRVEKLLLSVKSYEEKILSLKKEIEMELEGVGIDAQYDSYGSYRSEVVVKTNALHKQLHTLERMRDEVITGMVNGALKWTRTNLVFWLENEVPETMGKYKKCFENWRNDKEHVDLKQLNDLVLEVLGIADAQDRDQILQQLKTAMNSQETTGGETCGEEISEGCVVCMSKPPTHLFYPCGHLCACEDCADALKHAQPNALNCPVCRERTNDVVKVFV